MCKKNFPIWDFKKKILGFHHDEFAHLIIIVQIAEYLVVEIKWMW